MVAAGFACFYYVLCLLCTVILWVRGIGNVFGWFIWAWGPGRKSFDERMPCPIMPGRPYYRPLPA